MTTALEAKRLGLLHELLPQATAVAALVDPKAPDSASQLRELQDAARALGLEAHVIQANTEMELDRGFATVTGQQRDALVVASSPLFNAQRKRIVELAARYATEASIHHAVLLGSTGSISGWTRPRGDQ